MFNLFGSKKKTTQSGSNAGSSTNGMPQDPSKTLATIQQLDKLLRNMEKRQLLLEKRVEKVRNDAKSRLKAGNQAGAKALMKQKMNLDKQLQQIFAYQEKISFVKDQLESRSAQADMMAGLQQATVAMKQSNGALDPDRAGEIMDDLNEQLDMQNEVADALSTRLAGEVDEIDIEDDLAELESEIAAEREAAFATEQPSVPVISQTSASTSATASSATQEEARAAAAAQLPSAPVNSPEKSSSRPTEFEDMDAELAALEAEMA